MNRNTTQRNGKKDTTLLIAIICAAVLAAIIFVIASRALSSGDGNTNTEPTSPTDQTVTEDSASTTPPVTDGTADGGEDTEADTAATEEPPATSEPFVTEEPPFVDPFDYRAVEKGEARELSDLSKSVFIGDSRTEGLRLYTALASSGARVYSSVGMTVFNSLTGEVAGRDGKKIVLRDALEADTDFESVYIMLGINELGWNHISGYTDAYGKIIDEVRTMNPDAKIYIQSLLPVTKTKSDSDDIFTNDRIREFNRALSDLAQSKGVYYLNVAEVFSDNGGALPGEASSDGVHLNKAYCNMWLDYILCHRK